MFYLSKKKFIYLFSLLFFFFLITISFFLIYLVLFLDKHWVFFLRKKSTVAWISGRMFLFCKKDLWLGFSRF